MATLNIPEHLVETVQDALLDVAGRNEHNAAAREWSGWFDPDELARLRAEATDLRSLASQLSVSDS